MVLILFMLMYHVAFFWVLVSTDLGFYNLRWYDIIIEARGKTNKRKDMK